MATDAWKMIFTHEGQLDRFRGIAVCVWAAYGTLSLFGLIHPLKWLPIVLFMIFYKTLWLIVVAYPLWKTNTLKGSSAEELANIFIWVLVPLLFIPWKYFFKKYILLHKK